MLGETFVAENAELIRMADTSRGSSHEERPCGQEKEEETTSKYNRSLTVFARVIGSVRLTTMDVLTLIREECGVVTGCRVRSGGVLEVTMETAEGKRRLMDGVKSGASTIMGQEINSNEMVVSFLNLPVYITDDQIHNRLKEWRVGAVSAIKRRMWPGTDVADGTRFMKVKFTDEIKSLPYSTRFNTMEGVEHFRVIHDRQERICRQCLKPGHIYRECPEFKCFKCGERGHFARECGRENEEGEGTSEGPDVNKEGQGGEKPAAAQYGDVERMEESVEEEEHSGSEQVTGCEEAGQTDGGTGRSEGGGDCDQSAVSERAGTNGEGGEKGGKVKDRGPLARGGDEDSGKGTGGEAVVGGTGGEDMALSDEGGDNFTKLKSNRKRPLGRKDAREGKFKCKIPQC